jgi:hypothetical protein
MDGLNLSQDPDGGDGLPATLQKGVQTEELSSSDSDVDQTTTNVLSLVGDEENKLFDDIERFGGSLVEFIDTDSDGLDEKRSASELWTAEGLFSFLFSNGISYFNIETKDRRVLQAPRSFLAGLVHDSLRQLTFNVFKSMRAFIYEQFSNQPVK